MKNRNDACVIKCIKANRNRFGFGHTHKVGQYITYDGRGSNINNAHVYGRDGDIGDSDSGREDDNNIPFEDSDTDEWKKYYVVVPVEIIPRKIKIV